MVRKFKIRLASVDGGGGPRPCGPPGPYRLCPHRPEAEPRSSATSPTRVHRRKKCGEVRGDAGYFPGAPLAGRNLVCIWSAYERFSSGGWDMTEILVQSGTEAKVPSEGRVIEHPAWPVLKDAVERIRPWQNKDGSIDF